MPTNNDKTAAAETKRSQKQPRTQIGDLRDLLTKLERRIAKLKEISSADALEILSLLDQASNKFETLEKAGGSIGSEATQLESLLRQFQGKRRLFIGRIGGTAVMQQARRERRPDESNWWWFIDKALNQERQSKVKRWIAGLIIWGTVLTVLGVIYQQFFAPDPTFQAGIGFQQTAENNLIAGQFEAALEDVNQAIEHLPNMPELYVMRGVIFEMLEQPELAEVNYELTRDSFEREESFYTARARYYLMAGLPERAIADAQVALSINPDSAVSYLYIAQANEMLADFAKAIEFYEIASEVAQRINNPTLQVMARMQLATLLQQMAAPTAEIPKD